MLYLPRGDYARRRIGIECTADQTRENFDSLVTSVVLAISDRPPCIQPKECITQTPVRVISIPWTLCPSQNGARRKLRLLTKKAVGRDRAVIV